MGRFDLCLFDLDDTLVHSSYLELDLIRRSMVNAQNLSTLQNYLNNHALDVVSQDFIIELKNNFPNMKLGVFSRAPKLYVITMLKTFFSNFLWDSIISYEDVKPFFKPHPQGVYKAMSSCKILDAKRVLIIGDDNTDIKVANNSGCPYLLWKDYFVSKEYANNLQNKLFDLCKM